MKRNSCPIGYIYALMFKSKPVYIGKTTNTASSRFLQHKSNYNRGVDKNIYTTLREMNIDFTSISLKVLRCVPKIDLDYYEKRYIKYCKSKGIILFNKVMNN